MLSRRDFLAALSMACSSVGAGMMMSAPALAKTGVRLYGPPGGPSVVLAKLAQLLSSTKPGGAFSGANSASEFHVQEFKAYLSMDRLRAGLISGDWQIAAVPTYVAANLYNRGVKIRLLNVMSWGMLSVISSDEAVVRPDALKGQTVGMFFRNDMPDLVFREMMQRSGLALGEDYKLRYVGTPIEALQLLLAGRISHCVLPEPLATAALLKGRKLGKSFYSAMDLAKEWTIATGAGNGTEQGAARLPVAGLVVQEALLQQQPNAKLLLRDGCEQATDWVLAHPDEAALLSSEVLSLAGSMIAQSLPHSNLTHVSASAARSELEFFFQTLKQRNPAIIGGDLPDDGFYL